MEDEMRRRAQMEVWSTGLSTVPNWFRPYGALRRRSSNDCGRRFAAGLASGSFLPPAYSLPECVTSNTAQRQVLPRNYHDGTRNVRFELLLASDRLDAPHSCLLLRRADKADKPQEELR